MTTQEALVPVGSVTDQLDGLKVLLSGGFGFNLWGGSRYRCTLALKEQETEQD